MPVEILGRLKTRGIQIWAEDGRLRFRAPKGALTPDLRNTLELHKNEIIRQLTQTAGEISSQFPLSYNQQSQWFLYRMAPASFAYNVALVCRVVSTINADAMLEATRKLIKRHPILRTTYGLTNGKEEGDLCQTVHDELEPGFYPVDASGWIEDEIKHKVHQYYAEPFDLEHGPILRLYLIRRSDEDHILMITVHHIACDGWSINILWNDLKILYRSEITGTAAELTEVAWQYTDFIQEQAHMLTGQVGKALNDFWKGKLAGKLPYLNLPTDFDRPLVPRFQGASHHFELDRDDYANVIDFTKAEKVTPYIFFLAAFQMLLMRLSNQSDILVGTPSAGRTRPEYKDIFGNFINPIVMRGDLSGDLTFREHLNRTRKIVFQAIEYQDYPFPMLVENIGPDRDISRSPIFQVMFNILNRRTLGPSIDFFAGASPDVPLDYGDVKALPFYIDQQEGQFDLTLEIIDTDQLFACVLKYSTDLFREETIAAMAFDFQIFLKNSMADPQKRISNFPISEDRYRKQPTSKIRESRKKVAVAATFTSETLQAPLEFWFDKLGVAIEILFTPYNQVFQQLLDPSSLFSRNADGINVVLLRFDDWLKDRENASRTACLPAKTIDGIKQSGEEFLTALTTAVERSKAYHVICFCPSSPDIQANEAIRSFLAETESELIHRLRQISGVVCVGSKELWDAYPVKDYYEPMGEKVGHIPFTQTFIASLATMITRKIYSFINIPIKAIILDCDQTLWKGVVGEDGPLGVKINPVYRVFQELLVSQYEAGRLICLCSKNNESDVFEVFDRHPDMILKREHISFHRINWLAKSLNIRSLAEEINIGLESFLFIDDSPIECAEVTANCPDVTTLQLPQEPKDMSRFIRHVWAFDHQQKTTEEDRKRTHLYKQALERDAFLRKSLTFGDFIQGLDLKISISEMSLSQLPRVSQLTQRTNQFNFTTIRRSEADIRDLIKSGRYACHVVEVNDRFGDYGLVGVVLFETQTDAIKVDTFLLSCRVLGRGVEHAVMASLGREAIKRNKKNVELSYFPTAKNQPAFHFLQSVGNGFEQKSEAGLKFCLPAIKAASISFMPLSMDIGLSPQEEGDSDPSGGSQYSPKVSNAAVIQEIAEKLSEPTQLQSAIALREKIKSADKVRPDLVTAFAEPRAPTEKNVASVWKDVLGLKMIGVNDNFFELGGRSILMPRVVIQLKKTFGIDISLVDMFQYPTIALIARCIDSRKGALDTQEKINAFPTRTSLFSSLSCERKSEYSGKVAIIGMSGRFPGAGNITVFWENLINGVESVTDFSDEELAASDVPKSLLDNAKYVKRSPVLDSIDMFDASFFGYSPREAAYTDPQHRIFLECAWHALEDAGYDSEQYHGLIGVYAGCGMNNYLLKNILARTELMESILNFQTFISNDKDFLSTRASYKLGLTGPSLVIQTACSTSLVAVQLACQSLQTHQCDMALAGGVSTQTPRLKGYLYNEGEIFSRDGVCRPFDKQASGTLLGEGCGVVMLKRLEDALADRDHIYAVIIGAAVNNDGSIKVGYTAPGVTGQSEVISMAHDFAGIDPVTIGYVEAHGTGTRLGDPIEVAALTQAFRRKTDKKGFCALGSVKSNIGHLDIAAGIAGLIKATLSLKYKQIPPTIHFIEPNPELNLEKSPFYINTRPLTWNSVGDVPRRVGVSSFGVGGTNAHIIVEEPPSREKKTLLRPYYLIPISAKTEAAVAAATRQLADHLRGDSNVNIADAAYTLQVGRRAFKYRKSIVCRDGIEALQCLDTADAGILVAGSCDATDKPVVFMFTGQGAQYVNMAKEIYAYEPEFKRHIDYCAKMLRPHMGLDIREIIYPPDGSHDEATEKLNQTAVSQPALFMVEYAFARLWMSWGVKPQSMIGHSIGEYVAACLSGVFSLDEALKLVASRGRLMQEQPPGSMLAVSVSEKEIQPLLEEGVSVAVINAPSRCVVSGPTEAIDDLHRKIIEKKLAIQCTRLHTSHAFHSDMMEPVVKPFTEIVKKANPTSPRIPFISNFTGTWITDGQASDPAYWSSHLRGAVRFSQGVDTLLEETDAVFLEVGPGNTLCSLCRQHGKDGRQVCVLQSMRHPNQKYSDEALLLKTVSQLWVAGVSIKWSGLHRDDPRNRIPLPGYPFERKRFWVVPQTVTSKFEMNEGDVMDAPFNEQNMEFSLKHERPDIQSKYVAPIREADQKLSKIWQEVLGIEKVGINDDFFELGGNSLIAAQMISRIRGAFHNELPVQKVFEIPTIAMLSEFIESAEFKSGECRVLPFEKRQQSGAFPLSLSQQRLWFINELEPLSPAYNIVQAIRIVGDINESHLQRSLDAILARHEVLRTVFKTEDGRPIAEVTDRTTITIEKIDTENSRGGNGEERARAWVRKNAPILFDLEKGPLIRAFLFNIGAAEHFFVLIMHHIISDGWSMGVWMNELAIFYSAFESMKSTSLPDLPVQYSDYAIWQKKWLEQKDLSEQEAYWKKQLAGPLPVMQLPADYPRPAEPKYTGMANFFFLSRKLTKELRYLSKKESTSLYVVMLATYMAFLSRYSGLKDIIVGSPYANRDMVETETLIGFFLNMLPIRVVFSDGDSFTEMIRKVHSASFEALAHKDLPFEQLVKILQPERSLNFHPLFQVMFAFQNFPIPIIEKALLTFFPTVMDRGSTEFDFSLYMWEENDELHGIFEYSLELFQQETVMRMVGHFQKLIERLVAEPAKALSMLPLLLESEEKQLLIEWNNTRVHIPDDVCFHQLFEAQVGKTPDAIALEFYKDRLTYRELDQHANQLANYLKKFGVGPDVYVGICIERSLEMMVGLLAILKAGGAYVPLDPEYPKERLAYMLECANVQVLLTQESLKKEIPKNAAMIVCIDRDWETISREIREKPVANSEVKPLTPDHLAYVIFTSGSTGKPKGVQIPHRALVNFLKSMEHEPGFSSQDVLLAITTLSFDIAGLELYLPLITGGKTIIASRNVAGDGIQLRDLLSSCGATMVQATPSSWRMLLAAGWEGNENLYIFRRVN